MNWTIFKILWKEVVAWTLCTRSGNQIGINMRGEVRAETRLDGDSDSESRVHGVG